MKKISEIHKNVIDEYFCNGMNRSKAYAKYYETEGLVAARSFYKLLLHPEVAQYYKESQEALSNALAINKHSIVMNLAKDLEANDELTALALKDELTEAEQDKFDRLSKVLSQTGKVQTINTIAKIIGAFEPEKVQVEMVNYTVNFGTEKG